jgi:hypothetical protein
MKLTRALLIASLATVGLYMPRAASAAEDDQLEFVHALQSNNYADIAVEYLNDMKASNKLPDELADVWDLEMSKCLRSAAKQAYNAEEAKKDMADAQKYLDKFLKEKPDHPEAVSAGVWWAGFSTDKAMDELRMAEDKRQPKAARGEHLQAARAALEDAKPRFVQAAAKFRATMLKAPAGKKREEAKDKWQDARFKAILCDYFISQTFDNPDDPNRKAMLEKASQEFDDVFQVERTAAETTFIGRLAHMWQGKTVLDLGKDDDALDIFDEVVVGIPDNPAEVKRTELEMAGLYAQVEEFRLEIIAKKSFKKFVDEARAWRQLYRDWKATEGYQQITLKLAKALFAQSEKATAAAEKTKFSSEAIKLLNEMVHVTSPFQQEAIKLRKEHGAAAGNSFEDEIVSGNESFNDKKYADAIPHYQHALELAGPKDKKKADEVRETLAGCYYSIAHEQFTANKLDDCMNTLKILIIKHKDTNAAPIGAFLAVTTMLTQYMALPPDQKDEKAKALQHVIKMADFATQQWPSRPETDDIRITLGQAYLVSGEVEKALKQFDSVNPKSERYASALRFFGQTNWHLYLLEKRKEAHDDKALAAYRDKAVTAIAQSVELQHKAMTLNSAMPRPLQETQLLLAEMRLEENDPKASAVLFQPLIEDIQKQKPDSLDENMLRIFLGAVKAYMGAGDLDKAGAVGMVLIELGPDTDKVNAALVQFAKLVEGERKKADAAVTQAVSASEIDAAKAHLAAMDTLLGKLLTKLAAREKISAAGMVWIAETSRTVGLDDPAEQQCEKFLQRLKDDPDFKEKAGKAAPRVGSLLIRIQVDKGKFKEASEQVKELMKTNPRALEPRLVDCRVSQAWAEKDPTKFAEAVNKWDTLRRQLEKAKKKGKLPPEFFEVAYYEAVCLGNEAQRLDKKGQKTDAADMASKGEKILKSILYQDKTLSGPDMKAKYDKLIDDLEVLQGRQPASQKAVPGKKK